MGTLIFLYLLAQGEPRVIVDGAQGLPGQKGEPGTPVGVWVVMPKDLCQHCQAVLQPQLNRASLSSRAALAPLGALAHRGPLVIQVPPVCLDPWGHQDLRESL